MSQWGHDFVQIIEYQGCLKQKISDVPVMVVIATATKSVRKLSIMM
ncbi:putative DNA helicase [Helianthus debilis subsp. tardiflorus]